MTRTASLASSVLKSNLGLLKRPYKLNLYLTDKCNCKCKTCLIWKKRRTNELSLKELRTFFGMNNYFNWIDITGGEIFLRKDVDKIFDTIIHKCENLLFLHFPTNGVLTEKIRESVEKIKNEFGGKVVVTVSVDGPEELHDLLRGVKGCWQRAVQTFQQLEEINKGNVFLGFTSSRYNAGKLSDTFTALEMEIPGLSLDRMHLNLAQTSALYYSNSGEYTIGKAKESIGDIDFVLANRGFRLTPFHLLESRYLRMLRAYASSGSYPMRKCTALYCTVSINPQGDVYPCLFFDRKLGSLRKVDFELDRILSNEVSEQLRKDVLKHCPRCWSACEAYPSIMSNLL